MPLALLLKGHITFTILMFQEEEKESPSRQRRRARREAERVKEKNKTSGKDVEKVEDRVEGVTKVDDISNLQEEFCPDNIYSDKGTENVSLFDETSVEPRPEIELKDEIEDEIDYNLRNNVNIDIERKANVRIFSLVKIQDSKRRII